MFPAEYEKNLQELFKLHAEGKLIPRFLIDFP